MTNNDKVPELTNREFEDFTKRGLVLIDFFAEWHMPCLIMEPIINELGERFKGKIKFGRVDVSENQELTQKLNIISIPNFTLFKDRQILEQFVGSMSSEEMEEKLEKFLEQ